MGCVNGRGFNFDVAPSLVGIWCPLISRVGDSEMRRFGVRSGVRDKGRRFGDKDQRVRVIK